MKMNETVAGLTITAKTEGVDQAKKQVDALTQSTQQLGVVSEQSSKGAISLEDKWKRATLRFDEAARAQANIARETKLANQVVEQGVATQQQVDEHLARVTQRYTSASTATKDLTQQTGLARHELVNLGRQVQDIGVQLVSGQSPFMIIAQQVPQMADVFISSGKSVGDFFSQAIGWAGRFLTSTAGIVTAVVAIGAAAAYTAYQFLKSSTTMEQALENQNRLMKEGMELSKSKDQLQFEMSRNQIDLQKKYQQELKNTAALSERRATSPLQDVGAALGIIAPPKQDPGYAAIADALKTLNAAIASGQGSAQAYGAELSRIAGVHPELAKTVEKMLLINEAAIKAGESLREAGVSLATLDLNKLRAVEAAAATDRMTQATRELAALYPGMSIEVTKQLDALDQQLRLAQARTPEERAMVQEIVTQNKLWLEGKTTEEQMAIAAKERLVTETQINAELAKTVDYLLTAYEKEQGMKTTWKDTADAAGEVTNETNNINNSARQTGDHLQRNVALMTDFANQSRTAAFWGKSIAQAVDERLSLLPTQFSPTDKFESTYDPLGIQRQKRALEERVAKTGEGQVVPGRRSIGGEILSYEIKYDKSLVDRLSENTEATKENTAATSTMTDVLSPFYSSDPRSTHLGFRAFSGGGIMTAHGELPLKQYQGGGVASSPQVAVYGEGRTPEAYVPVPSGRIPVEIRQPANSNQRPVHVTINVRGNADANTVSALKSTAFQQAQAMRRAMR